METNRERFLESLINRTHVVLGRALQPFCLWHMINLARIGSPFLTGRPPQLEDLIAAVWICSSTPDTDPAKLSPPRAGEHLKVLIEFLTGLDLPHELEKFRAYKRDYASPPRRWDPKGEPLKCPWELAVIARLMRYGKMAWREALVFPFGLAMWLAGALGEANGGDPGIMSEAEEKALKEAGWINAS